MGGSGSALQAPEAQERISAQLDDVLESFCHYYTVAWKNALVQQATAQPPPPSGERLPAAVRAPPGPLHAGYLHKEGASYRTWRRRWFVAHGAEQNFDVVYFESRDASRSDTNLKGVMQLDGYHLAPFSPDDASRFGPFGLRMESPGRRTWLVRAESQADIDDWRAVFSHAARHASAPLSRDAVLREAFVHALTRTRAAYGYHAPWRPSGNEQTCLCAFVTRLVWERVLRELLPGCSIDDVDASVHNSVRAAVTAAWRGCSASTDLIRKTMGDAVRRAVPRLLQEEATARQRVRSALSERVQAQLERAMPAANALLGLVWRPVVLAYAGAVHEVRDAAGAALASDRDRDEALAAAFRKLHARPAEQALARCVAPLAPMREALSAVLAELGSPAAANDVYLAVLDALRALVARALCTLADMCRGAADREAVDAHLRTALDALQHDARLLAAARVRAIVEAELRSSVAAAALAGDAADEALGRAADAFGDDGREFLDISEIAQGVVRDSVGLYVDSLMTQFPSVGELFDSSG